MTIRDVVFLVSRQAFYEHNHYPPVVRSNGLLFISGQVGSRDDGPPEPELGTQIRRAFDDLDVVLVTADCGFDGVLDVIVLMTGAKASFECI